MDQSDAQMGATTAASAKWFDAYVSCYGTEEPSPFAKAMAETIPIEAGKTKLLDIGCGSGIIGLYAILARGAHSVTFTDLFPKWLHIAQCNADIRVRAGAIQPSQVSFTKAGQFARLDPEIVYQHNLLAFNPPQLPTALVEEDTLIKLAADPIQSGFRIGGRDGLRIVRNFLKWYSGLTLADSASSKPDAVLLLSSFLGRRLIEKTIASYGLQVIDEKPVETPATLRKMFWKKADELSHSPVEIEDRSLARDGEVWKKKLLTYRLNNR